MKKILLFLLIIIMCFGLCSCKKEEEIINDKPNEDKIDEKVDIRKNITLQDIGLIVGEYSHKYTVIKVSNSNDRAIYVDVKLTYYNNNNEVVDNKNVYVRVGSKKSAYAIYESFYEDPDFSTYKYDFDVSTEKLESYESIYNNVKVTYIDTGKGIDIDFLNNGNVNTTASAYVLFRNNGNIVAINEVTEYDLMPLSKKTKSISYPYKNSKKLISYDRIEVVLNEVSTEL